MAKIVFNRYLPVREVKRDTPAKRREGKALSFLVLDTSLKPQAALGWYLRPLYVSAVGVDLVNAADNIRRMHGPHRLPTLLKQVDGLCRAG